jgi:hypothetical protein
MTRRKWTKYAGVLATVGAVAGGLMIAGATSAQAHARETTVKAGQLPIGIGYLSASHIRVKTCDIRADDRGVRTHYWLSNGYQSHVGDANGEAEPCSDDRAVGTSTNPVVQIQVCAGRDGRDEFCSPPVAA